MSDFTKNLAEKYVLMKAISAAIQEQGPKLIFLLRLCPLIPFNAFNYLMGITGVSATDFAIGSLGMIPATLVYVFLGTTISDIADAASGKTTY